MAEYICKQCGYHKTSKPLLDYVLEPPVYPVMTSSGGMLPFMAMEYMWDHEEVCPNCSCVNCWDVIP